MRFLNLISGAAVVGLMALIGLGAVVTSGQENLQALIDACPPEACVIELPAGQWDLEVDCEVRQRVALRIHDRERVKITGQGQDHTRIRLWPASGTCNKRVLLMLVENVRWFELSGVRLDVRNLGPTGENWQGNGIALYLHNVQDARIHGNHLHALGTENYRSAAMYVNAYRNSFNRQVVAYDNLFHASGAGAAMNMCEQCSVTNNWFSPMEKGGWGLIKRQGSGFVAANNRFDLWDFDGNLEEDGRTWSPIRLVGGVGGAIWNNQIWIADGAMDNVYGWGLLGLYGYRGALVQGNQFFCEEEKCEASGIHTHLVPGGPEVQSRDNVIDGNNFIGFDAKTGGFSHCPITHHGQLGKDLNIEGENWTDGEALTCVMQLD